MARRIRKRFILLAMAALIATLLLTFGSVYAVMHRGVTRDADELIGLIARNGGSLPSSGFHEFGMNEETPYASRYYVVWTDGHGSYTAANLDHITLSTAAKIGSQVSEILSGGKAKGYVSESRFSVFSSEKYSGTYMIIVLDCSGSLRTLEMLSTIMLITFAVVVTVVLALLLWLSKYAVRPFEENQEKQRQFITDAGHELKTPLAIISSNAEVQEMTTGESKWLDNIKAQTGRISQLVKSMIELSKMDEEKRAEEPRQELCISEIVGQTAEAFSAVAQTRGIVMRTEIEPDVHITGYLEDMTRLAGILVDNAVKYTDQRAYLCIRLEKKGRRACLTVSNSCAGMDEEALPRLFDRFYRADASRSRETGGYGIGLSMAQMLVQRQKGRLSVDYDENGIIHFTAEL